jgi:hypothetical protein
MIARRGATLLTSALVTGLALVGCGGDEVDSANDVAAPAESTAPETNGVEGLSADEILEEAKNAATAADSVRISGEVVDDGSTIVIDMQYSGDGSSGTIGTDGATLELLRVGTDQYYMKADADTWEQLTGEAASGEIFADRYVRIPGEDESLGDLTSFLDFESFVQEALNPDGAIEKGETAEVNGVQAIGLVDQDSEDGGTLWVALTGEPYPLRIESPDGSGEGAVDFLDWGEAVDIQAPAEDEVIDLSN